MRRILMRAGYALLLLLVLEGPVVAGERAIVTVPDEDLKAEAAKNGPVKWKFPLGDQHIDDMAVPSAGRLLIGLRNDPIDADRHNLVMLDLASGQPVWRYKPKKASKLARVLMMRDLLIYRVDRRKRTSLMALDPRDGTESWRLPEMKGRVSFRPLPGVGLMLAIRLSKKKATVTAYELASGEQRWERKFSLAVKDGAALPAPLATLDGLWVFYNGAERISPADGETLWRRDDLVMDAFSPFPRLFGDSLYLVDSGRNLHRISDKTGKSIWQASAPEQNVVYTNIFPLDERVYLRGVLQGEAAAPHRMAALDNGSGKLLWRYGDREPAVSNLMEYDGRVYFATPSGVGALGLSNGGRQFFTTITNSGRTFPVHIKRHGNKIVFIGELIVAAVGARDGSKIYSHGFDPVDKQISMTSISGSIRRLQGWQSGGSSDAAGMLAFYSMETARYQELSNHYAAIARQEMRSAMSGSGLSKDMALMRARGASMMADLNNSFARMDNMMAIYSAGEAVADAMRLAGIEYRLREQNYFRHSILSAYAEMESGDYVYRPMLDYTSKKKQFVGVAVIHTPTGKINQTNISAPHSFFGLWNLIDFEKGIVYHNGIGLDSGDYKNYMLDDLETFLIAQPVRIPK